MFSDHRPPVLQRVARNAGWRRRDLDHAIGKAADMLSVKTLLTTLDTDLWRIRRKDLPPRKSFWLRQA